MSNPNNQFQQGFTFEQFLDANGGFLQGKVDKPGGAVSAVGSNQRLASTWANLVDDLILTVAESGIAAPVPSFEFVNNTSAPLAIPAIGTGASFDSVVDVPTNRNMLELVWWSITRTEVGGATQQPLRVIIFHDTGSTKPISDVSFPQGDVQNDEAGFKGHTLMLGPGAEALEVPGGGLRRFHLRVTNTGPGTSTPAQFAYIVRTFDLTVTAIPIEDEPMA